MERSCRVQIQTPVSLLGRLTNRFASVFQNSWLRMKLTSTTFFLVPLCSSSEPNAVLGLGELNAAWRNLRTNQFEVAPRIEEARVRDESGRSDTYGARRGGSGG